MSDIVSEEELMAFADGMLEGGARERVAAAVANDAALTAKVDRMRRATAMLRGAFDEVLGEPAPARHTALFDAPAPAGNVIAFPKIMRSRPAWIAAAAAACLAVAFLGGRASAPPPLMMAQADGVVASGALARALATQASGMREGARVQIALSVPAEGGGYCRAFTIEGAAGLACSEGAGWSVVALADAEASRHGDYAQAAGELPASVLAAASARQAGDALDAEAEAAALRAGWRQ